MYFSDMFNHYTVTSTTNGDVAYTTTNDKLLDIFFKAHSLKGEDTKDLWKRLILTHGTAKVNRAAFYIRDREEGQGIRSVFRDYLAVIPYPILVPESDIYRFFGKIVELGRYDDLLFFTDKQLKKLAAEYILRAIKNGDRLAAKWMPRKGPNAVYLRTAWGMSPKTYRKFLVEHTDVVETKLCNKDCGSIDYHKIPSRAMLKYTSTFLRNDYDRFAEYLDSLKNKPPKVSGIYPGDLVKAFEKGAPDQLINESFNKMVEDFKAKASLSGMRMLPVIDVSGSMYCHGEIHHALGIGYLLARANEGVYADKFVTFSADPKFVHLGEYPDLATTVLRNMKGADWGMNTDLEKTLVTMLHLAVTSNTPNELMPTHLVILSDMQFDECSDEPHISVIDKCRELFERSGYTFPKIVFWNLSETNYDNYPVQKDETGVLLLSGANHSIVKALCEGVLFEDPVALMEYILKSERYSI